MVIVYMVLLYFTTSLLMIICQWLTLDPKCFHAWVSAGDGVVSETLYPR